jgi:hypothetical protein
MNYTDFWVTDVETGERHWYWPDIDWRADRRELHPLIRGSVRRVLKRLPNAEIP